MNDHILGILNEFKNKKILVIGDAMLDLYVHGTVERINREAPTPIVQTEKKLLYPGGAGNTAVNTATLGAYTTYISIIGTDSAGSQLMQSLTLNNVHIEHMIYDEEWTTIQKKRICADKHILLRIDEGSHQQPSRKTGKELIRKVKQLYKSSDAIILSDYGYGTITDGVIDAIHELQSHSQKTIIVDSKDARRFKKLQPTAIKPNYSEATKLLKLEMVHGAARIEQMKEKGKKLFEMTGTRYVIITLDADGTLVLEKGKKPYVVKTKPRQNTQAIGAGDTFTSALSLALISGTPVQLAAEIASRAAAVAITKEETAVCTVEELLQAFEENPKKTDSVPTLTTIVDQLKAQGKKIVFTNGCFDIVHRGHVTYLNEAKAAGDILIIGVNSDASIKRLKGENRPINSLEDRMAVLSGLGAVDYVIPFEENTPIELIKQIKPDIYVKGGDYTLETLPEAPVVNALGGEVRLIPFVADRSTTKMIQKIRESYTPAPARKQPVYSQKNYVADVSSQSFAYALETESSAHDATE